MPKLVVSNEQGRVSEWRLTDKEVVIGRGGDCQVCLDDPAVSRHHAKVARIYTGYFVEDLESTNGVNLNGRRVRKHMLKDGDTVQIGTHELRFVAGDAELSEDIDPDKTVVLRPRKAVRPEAAVRTPEVVPAEEGAPAAAADTPVSPDPRPVGKPSPQSGAASLGKAYLHHLSGPLRGETKLVDKSLYTIGQPGGTLAVISRRAKGYVLLHLGGDDLTTLNGQAVLGAGVALNQGDMIQVGDRRMEFRLEG